ncbi:MAG: hypothetical protein FJW30_11715 [Acidobacteria bacterium]|nr:hypothetical protein [Acidobacteriota bacterium]
MISALALPPQVENAPLLRLHGGYKVFPGLLAPEVFTALRHEAGKALPAAQESNVPRSCAEGWRGGNPARKFLTAPGGAVQESYYRHPKLLEFLSGQLGCDVLPTGLRGTFTFYSRPGDFIGIHRDIETCDVAVITALEDGPWTGNSGISVFYPTRIDEDNAEIRRSPAAGARVHRLEPGETVVLMGGVVAHAVLPVGPSQRRAVSVLCYRMAGG